MNVPQFPDLGGVKYVLLVIRFLSALPFHVHLFLLKMTQNYNIIDKVTTCLLHFIMTAIYLLKTKMWVCPSGQLPIECVYGIIFFKEEYEAWFWHGHRAVTWRFQTGASGLFPSFPRGSLWHPMTTVEKTPQIKRSLLCCLFWLVKVQILDSIKTLSAEQTELPV